MTLHLHPNTTRKDYPLYSGLLSYFPNALAYVSYVSKKANDQHNPGEPLHWAREKSTDHADCLVRHLLKKGERDDDGLLETGKVAWRALALLEEELEARSAEAEITPSSGCVFADLGVEVPDKTPRERKLFDGQAMMQRAQEVRKMMEKWSEKAAPAATLYDWSTAPPWAEWAARDSNGESFFYEVEPYLLRGDCWVPLRGEGRIRKTTTLSGNDDVFVHTSLEARPQRSAQL